MATPSARTVPTAAESRKVILDTAARLFREEGYAAVSLRDLATACGMKAGSLYYHFASKDEIVAEVLRIGVERVYEEVSRAVDTLPPGTSPVEVFRVAVRCHLRTMLELHDYTSANIRIFGQLPEAVRAGHIELRDAYESKWSELIGRFVLPAGMNPRLVRFFLIGAMNGTLEWFHAGQMTVDEVAEQLTQVFLRGFVQ